MHSSQVSLTSSMLNFKSNAAPGLILNKGEIVGGQVQEVRSDGTISLLIQGKLVEALSEVDVEKGQQIYLAVEDFREGRIHLKVVTSEALAQLGESNLAENLKTMGVSVDPQSVAVAKKLLQYGLPATRENFNEVNRGVKMVGGFTPQNIELVVSTMAGKLPINEPALAALKQYFTADTNIGKLVEGVIQLVNQLMENPGSPFPRTAAAETDHFGRPSLQAEPAMHAATTAAAYETAPIHADDLPVGPGTQLKTIVGSPASSRAAVFADIQGEPAQAEAYLQTPAQADGDDVLPGKFLIETVEPGEAGRRQALGLIKELLRELVIIAHEESGINAEKMEARSREGKHLVKSLAILRDLLANVENNPSTRVSELLNRLSEVEKEIGSQQIANYLAQNHAGQDTQSGGFYISFPVQMGSNYHQVQLRVEREGSRKTLKDADRLGLVVALDTLHMGKVLFHVDWARNRQLGLRGVVENPQVGKYLEDNILDLTRALSEQGYQVENRGMTISQNVDEEAKFKLSLGEAPEAFRLVRIDITV